MKLVVIVLSLLLCVLACLFCRSIWRASKRSPRTADGADASSTLLTGDVFAGNGASFDASTDCSSGHAGSFDSGDCGSSSH